MRPPDGPGPPRCPGNEKFGFWFICAHPQPVPSATYLRAGASAAQSASGGEPHGAGREKSTTKPAKRLGKTRRRSRLGKRFAFPSFPQPRRQSTSGYISNVSTDNPRVTFSNGLTRGCGTCRWDVGRSLDRDGTEQSTASWEAGN